MMENSAVQTLSFQLHTVMSAPLPFVIVLAVVTAAIWRALAWRYAATIEGLEARIKQRDDEIAELKRKALERPATPEAKPAIQTIHDKKDATIKQMSDALVHTANARVASRVYAGLIAAIPELNAAMISAVKIFALTRAPMRPERQKPLFALDLGKWLTEMLPLLKAGHIEEARERSKELASEFAGLHIQ